MELGSYYFKKGEKKKSAKCLKNAGYIGYAFLVKFMNGQLRDKYDKLATEKFVIHFNSIIEIAGLNQ